MRQGERLGLLYYVECLGVGGAFQTTVSVARLMKSVGHDVVFASAGGPLESALEESDIPHVFIDTAVRHPSPTAVRRLVATVREFGIDLLCPNGFDCTLDAVPTGLITGIPILPTYGGMFNLPYPHPWFPCVNVFSHELMVDLVETYGWRPDTFRNVIARIDGERFSADATGARLRAELGIADKEKVVIMVCRHDSLKLGGVLTLLDAAEGIHRAQPDARLVLFGDGDSHAEIVARIDDVHRVCGARFILAPGSQQRTEEAFAMADLVVANGARSALEGMACGKTVVSVGPNGFCGALTPDTFEGFRRFNFDKGRLAGNPLAGRENLVGCVSRLLDDDRLRKRLGEQSLAYAAEHLVIQSAASTYEGMYRDGMQRWEDGRFIGGRVWLNWCGVVTRFYAYRAKHRFGRYRGAIPGELAPPPKSLDPDWRVGFPLEDPRRLVK